MDLIFNLLIAAALLAVAVVLILGLANMMKGGSANRSQFYMRMRVALQALAVLVVMGILWITSRG